MTTTTRAPQTTTQTRAATGENKTSVRVNLDATDRRGASRLDATGHDWHRFERAEARA